MEKMKLSVSKYEISMNCLSFLKPLIQSNSILGADILMEGPMFNSSGGQMDLDFRQGVGTIPWLRFPLMDCSKSLYRHRSQTEFIVPIIGRC